MSTETNEQQLELFSGGTHSSAPRSSRIPGRWLFQFGYDQVILTGIGCLIGIAVIFACGVERGKQLARAENRADRHEFPLAVATQPAVKSGATETRSSSKAFGKSERADGTKNADGVEAAKAKATTKTLGSLARYAIQVVAYSRLQLAKQELQRLQARGERAFLVTRGERTVVYVGPFPSQSNAHEKLVTLKSKYQDCFIKTL